MNPVISQQVDLDNALVAPEKRLKIERCNARIKFSKPQREATYQVTLDALKLSACYPAFLITIYPRLHNQEFVKLPSKDEMIPFIQELGYSDFMYQADNREISSARKEHMPYPRFTKVIINYFISKDKSISMRNKINLHTVRDDTLLGTLKFVSKTKDAQKYGALIPDGMINQDIKDSEDYKTYYDFAIRKVAPKKARKFKKVAPPSRKLSPVKEAEPAKKAKRVKRHAKKCTTAPTASIVIKDTPAAQVKEALKKSKQDSHMLHASGSGDGVGSQLKVPDESEDKTTSTDEGIGVKPGVPDVPTYESESDKESWGDSQDDKSNDDADNNSDNKDGDIKDDDGNFNAGDSERTDSDSHKDVDPNLNLKEDEEEETHDEEYVRTPDYYVPTNEESREENRESNEEEYADLYGDVNITPKDTKPEKEGKSDVKMTDASLEDVSQEKKYEQVVEDAHLTPTSTEKTDGSKQTSSVSFNFESKFLNLDDVPPNDSEVDSLMNVKTL
ncbi:hypothetical protein Tco_0549259 [Tanacetum coccineum]